MARPSSFSPGGYLTPALLLPAILLGGGSTFGIVRDGWLSALAIVPVAALLTAHFTGIRPFHRAAWPLIGLVCAIFLLGFVQMHWASEGLWWDSASRANARAGLELVGVEVNGPWSLTPDDTRLFLLRWLFPTAILLSVAGAGWKERQRTVALIGILGVLAALLTLAQQLDLDLLPYRDANGTGVGWFANPNHHGLFLACGLTAALLAIPSAARTAHRRATGFELSRPLVMLTGAILVIGMASLLTSSRAALPLLIMGAALAFLARPRQSVRPSWFTAALMALPILLVVLLLIPRHVELAYTGPDLAEDVRLGALPTILEGIRQAMPWGTGFGSFDRVYLGLEPIELLSDRALNEAHNEVAQWLLEGGLAGLFILLAFLALLWKQGRKRLRDEQAGDRKFLQAGAFIVLLIAIHSLIDYPTRTVALGSMAMAALTLWLVPACEASTKFSAVRMGLTGVTGAIALLSVPLLQQPFDLRAKPEFSMKDARGIALSARSAALGNDADRFFVVSAARDALARAPLEAAAFEALALTEPDLDRSNAYIDAGLSLSRRAGILPSLKLQRLLADERYDEAVTQALTLLRRVEPDANLLRAVRIAALDDGFASGLARKLKPTEHWVTPLFRMDEEASRFETSGSRKLLLALDPAEGSPPPHLVEPVITRLLDEGHFADTAELYRRLYPKRSAFDASPYTNARTRTDTTRFDWRFAKRSDIRTSQRGERIEIAGRGLSNEPIGWRFLALEQGQYRLTLTLTGSEREAAIIPEIICASGSMLADPVAANRTVQLDFTVDDACPLVLVRLRAVPTARPYRIALDDWKIQSLPPR